METAPRFGANDLTAQKGGNRREGPASAIRVGSWEGGAVKVLRKGRLRVLAFAVAVASSVALYPGSAAGADPTAGATQLTPSGQITLDASRAYNPWKNAPAKPPQRAIPAARPTVDAATYAKLKAAAATAAPARAGAGPSQGNVITNLSGFTGQQQDVAPNPCGCFPPDVNAAVGPTQILTVVNSSIAVFNKSGVVVGTPVSINTFFGYSATLLFDPRVLYDKFDNRWVVEAEGFKETATGPQFQFFAVSTGANAAGGYRKFALNMSAVVGGDNFWDYPEIGLNQDGVIFTGNVFTPGGFAGSTTFQFSLDALGNSTSGGTSSFVFSGLGGTTTPPIVVDRNSAAHLLTVPTSGSSLGHTFWNVPGHDLYSFLFGAGTVAVAAYSVPPAAAQPGTSVVLDTLDARMVADTYQTGASLFAVHSIFVSPAAAIRWYEIDVSSNGLIQQANAFRSSISADFNPSIAIDTTKRMVICSSTSDSSTFPSIECIGRLPSDAASTTGPFNVVFGGSVSQTDNIGAGSTSRWGDTSSVSPDKGSAPTSIFWANNETVQPSGTQWSTQVRKVSIT